MIREEKKNDAIVSENDKALPLRPSDKANVHQCIKYILNSCAALGEDIPSFSFSKCSFSVTFLPGTGAGDRAGESSFFKEIWSQVGWGLNREAHRTPALDETSSRILLHMLLSQICPQSCFW